jgi:hypothetical protein
MKAPNVWYRVRAWWRHRRDERMLRRVMSVIFDKSLIGDMAQDRDLMRLFSGMSIKTEDTTGGHHIDGRYF